MKFTSKSVVQGKEILANDHYVAIPYNCSEIAGENGIVKAGTIVPANDATAIGVVLSDVALNDNPNGTIVIHGFIEKSKLPVEPAAEAITALKGIVFMPVAE